MNREAIWTTLFTKIQGLAEFNESGRKLRHWDDCENMPSLFLTQGSENVAKTGRGLPNIYTMSGEIYIYVRNQSNGTPATQINDLIDRIVTALAPPEPVDGKQTLGGLVEDCWIEGQIDRDEGVLGEVGVAIIPVKILVSF